MEDKNFKKFVLDDAVYETVLPKKYLNRKPYKKEDNKTITAFIPGQIVKVYVHKNMKVKAGDKLLVLEAMKMKNDVISPVDGAVKELHVKENSVVSKGQILLQIE